MSWQGRRRITTAVATGALALALAGCGGVEPGDVDYTPERRVRPPTAGAEVTLEGLTKDDAVLIELTDGSEASVVYGDGRVAAVGAGLSSPSSATDTAEAPTYPSATMTLGQISACGMGLVESLVQGVAESAQLTSGELGDLPVTDLSTTTVVLIGPPPITLGAYGLGNEAGNDGPDAMQLAGRELMLRLLTTIKDETAWGPAQLPPELQVGSDDSDTCYVESDPARIAELVAVQEGTQEGTQESELQALVPGMSACT